MLRQYKIITLAPTCFGSRRNHHQGAVLCLAKATKYGLLCSSVWTQSMLWRHISLLCGRAVHLQQSFPPEQKSCRQAHSGRVQIAARGMCPLQIGLHAGVVCKISKHVDQPAKKRATPNRTHVLPLLNRRGWKKFIFKKLRICNMFCAMF